MRKMIYRTLLSCLLLFLTGIGLTQAQTFSVEEYKSFLQETKNLNADQLEEMHRAGFFKDGAPTNYATSEFSGEIDKIYNLTAYEKSLIDRNGFMVTERIPFPSFGNAFHNIYIKDLPVFVSTDAILHAVHKSYDIILMNLEGSLLIPALDEMLQKSRNELPNLASRYAGQPDMIRSLDDADVYLTVTARLLSDPAKGAVNPVFNRNRTTVDALMEMIQSESPANYPLFAETDRLLDFSQFTVRGHYTKTEELGRYFKAMMWIGRTEIYLSEIKGAANPPTPADIQRQTVMAALLAEALRDGDAFGSLNTIDQTLRFMIGESDNVTLQNVLELMTESNAATAADLLKPSTLKQFQHNLATKPYAGQKILSQILFTDPTSPDKITPASSLMLLGQRFIIDSYVMANVVYDKVDNPPRMLPSSLDVLFSLGNDAALHLLQPEIQKYNYAKHLAGLRYLIDSYEPEYWNSTLYTGWLGAIRSLNPPADRSDLPRFMQTAAWWQEKMNTQLASWAQLRHDNLLYAKQSYSGGIGCSYPKGYVEPIPQFYKAVVDYARRGEEVFSQMNEVAVSGYFANLAETCETLGTLATKELNHQAFTTEEEEFMSSLLSRNTILCGIVEYTGWYPKLFFDNYVSSQFGQSLEDQDLIVADVHTAPTDEEGNFVGWVVHVGTGAVNLAVVTCSDEEGNSTAYVGPVMSYHEHVSTNFERLTDEDWAAGVMLNESLRPAWTNAYLAGKDGGPRGEVVTLKVKSEVSGVENRATEAGLTASLKANVFPNPFAGATTISFAVPPSLAGEEVVVAVYDLQGSLVAELLHQTLPAGTYMTRWDGLGSDGVEAANGAYYYTITAGSITTSGKIDRLGR